MLVSESLLKRHPVNPIITPKDFPGSRAILNPGQTIYQGNTLLLLPVCHNSEHYRGKRVDITAHVATSADGVHFEINPEPLSERSEVVCYIAMGHLQMAVTGNNGRDQFRGHDSLAHSSFVTYHM